MSRESKSPERQAEPTRTVAARVKELRARNGKLTAAQLGERMAGLGFRWDRFTVQNLENGRRATVTLDEVFALAYVLNVAPAHLVVPLTGVKESTEGRVVYEPVPGVHVPPPMARGWIRGEAFIGRQDPRVYFAERPLDEWTAPKWEPPYLAEGSDGER